MVSPTFLSLMLASSRHCQFYVCLHYFLLVLMLTVLVGLQLNLFKDSFSTEVIETLW